jgi:hypothetical protein
LEPDRRVKIYPTIVAANPSSRGGANVARSAQRSRSPPTAGPKAGRSPGSGWVHRGEATNKIAPIAWQHINLQGRYEFQKAPDALNVDAIIGALIGLPAGRGLTLVA